MMTERDVVQLHYEGFYSVASYLLHILDLDQHSRRYLLPGKICKLRETPRPRGDYSAASCTADLCQVIPNWDSAGLKMMLLRFFGLVLLRNIR